MARQARAADSALKRNDFRGALVYAERAAHAAPQDINMWLMYGYAARGAGKMQTALDAYNRALQLNPSSVEALSGMAQTYVRMGQTDKAKELLHKVLALNPRRGNDLMIAGELFIQTGDYNGAIQMLQRADAIQPSPRADLLQALAYQHLHKPEQARTVPGPRSRQGAAQSRGAARHRRLLPRDARLPGVDQRAARGARPERRT